MIENRDKLFLSIKKFEEDNDLDSAMTLCIDYLKDHPDDEKVRKTLKHFLYSVEEIELSNSASREYNLDSIDKAFQDLIDENYNIRLNACDKLGNLGSKKAVKPLINALNDEKYSVRQSAIIALGKLESRKSINPIINCLQDKSVNVRLESIKVLEKFKDERAIEPLKRLSKDKNDSVQEAAVKAINKIKPQKRDYFVPKWQEYYPNLKTANKRQKDFYYKWLKEIEKGTYLDIGDNLCYIFVYLYSIIEEFIITKNINKLLNCFNLIEEGYGNRVNSYLINWKKEAYLFVDDEEKAFELEIQEKNSLKEALKLTILKPENEFIIGDDLVNWYSYYLTDFGVSNKNEIMGFASEQLNQFKTKNGKSLLTYFIDEFNYKNLNENDFSKLKSFFLNENRFINLKNAYETTNKDQSYHIINLSTDFRGFSGVPIFDFEEPKFKKLLVEKFPEKKLIIPEIVFEALLNEIKRILINSENLLRESKGIPKIGEGWISETELYYKIKIAFPDEKIIHHGRPKWLGRQHLDIYLPEKNVAIEYQGEQHDKPVEFFGGQEAFEYRQKLDKIKLKKCKENNCRLIYVYPDYIFQEVEKELQNLLLRN